VTEVYHRNPTEPLLQQQQQQQQQRRRPTLKGNSNFSSHIGSDPSCLPSTVAPLNINPKREKKASFGFSWDPSLQSKSIITSGFLAA
jgi:hypothetical protein